MELKLLPSVSVKCTKQGIKDNIAPLVCHFTLNAKQDFFLQWNWEKNTFWPRLWLCEIEVVQLTWH